VGEPDERWGEVGFAHRVVPAGTVLGPAEVTAYLRDRLAAFKVPRLFRFGTEPLPRTTSGKVQKHRLERVLPDR
jgi:fatty-acyl-CoA synthase